MAAGEQDNTQRTRKLEDYKYFLTFRTRWSDNDQYSHVNNAVYYHLIDSIVNTYLAERCGLQPSSTDRALPIGLVVSSYCNFYAPLAFPEPVTLGLRVVRLGRSSVEYEVGFFTGEKEVLLKNTEKAEMVKAVGGYTHVFVGRMERRPLRQMDATLREGLEAILVHDSGDPGRFQAKL